MNLTRYRAHHNAVGAVREGGMIRCMRCRFYNICNLSALPDYGCCNFERMP